MMKCRGDSSTLFVWEITGNRRGAQDGQTIPVPLVVKTKSRRRVGERTQRLYLEVDMSMP